MATEPHGNRSPSVQQLKAQAQIQQTLLLTGSSSLSSLVSSGMARVASSASSW